MNVTIDEPVELVENRCGMCGCPHRTAIPTEDDYPILAVCLHCGGNLLLMRKDGVLHKTTWAATPECCKAKMTPGTYGADGAKWIGFKCSACGREESVL